MNIFVGILIYQFIQLCIMIITMHDEDLLCIVLCYTNIFYILCLIFIYFYKNIKLFYQKHNYNLYKIYNKDSHYINSYYMKEKYVKRFLKETNGKIYVKLYKSGKNIKSIIPNQMIFNYKDIKDVFLKED